MAALRYCKSARKVLQRHNKSHLQSRHQDNEDVDGDIDLIQTKVDQLLQATHYAVDILTKQKMAILEREDQQKHHKEPVSDEEITLWKMNQPSLSCQHDEEMDHVNTLIAKEMRRSEVREMTRRGLCKFARMVRIKQAKEIETKD